MDLDSSLLRAFVAVVDELHFGRAAHELFISQQALSKRIARLESMLGVRLLDRDRRSVSLTAAGSRLLPEARQAVNAVDAVAAAVRPGPATLTVDVLDEHLSMLPRIRTINESDPFFSLSTVMRHDATNCVTTVRNGRADVSLGRPGDVDTPWPTDIQGCAVVAEPIQLLVPRGHELNGVESVTPTELSQHRLWFPTASAPAEWTDLLGELVTTFDLKVEQSGSTFGFDHWVEQVAYGSAPPSLVGKGMHLPPGLPIAAVPIVSPTPVFWWWAMWRRRLPANLASHFLSTLSAALSDIEPDHGTDLWMPQSDNRFRHRTNSAPTRRR